MCAAKKDHSIPENAEEVINKDFPVPKLKQWNRKKWGHFAVEDGLLKRTDTLLIVLVVFMSRCVILLNK